MAAPGMLLAYDAAGEIVATLDHRVIYAEDGSALGLVDFAAHEEAGGDHTDIWRVTQEHDGVDLGTVKGSKVWPEWLGARAHEFRVELEGPPGRRRIGALIHKASGHRRERADVEAAIARRHSETEPGEPVDLRDIVGGPTRPVDLDEAGRTKARPASAPHKPLPLVGRGPA